MANKLIYSASNVIQMFSLNAVQDEKYLSKDFEDFEFSDTILPWEQKTNFCQPWMKADSIALQLQTNVGPVAFVLKTCDGGVVDTVLMTQGAESQNEPGLYIFEILRPLNSYAEGCYYIELQFGFSDVDGSYIFHLRSGEISIKVKQPGTMLLQAKHFEFREDLIFETGFFPSIRFVGTKKYQGPKQQATVYNDQTYNLSALRSIKFRLWEVTMGGAKGQPDYFTDIIGGLIGCSTLMLDGKYYTVPDGGEMEPLSTENYPMRSWKMPLRERYNRSSRQYENDTPLNFQLTAIVNVDSKGFGNSNSGSQTAIIDVE